MDKVFKENEKQRVLATLRGGSEHNMLNLSEKPIRQARAYFRGHFPGIAHQVLIMIL